MASTFWKLRVGAAPSNSRPVYTAGSDVVWFAEHRDRLTNALTAPTDPTAVVYGADGALLDPSPTPTLVSTGIYSITIENATDAGVWQIAINSSGASVAGDVRYFEITSDTPAPAVIGPTAVVSVNGVVGPNPVLGLADLDGSTAAINAAASIAGAAAAEPFADAAEASAEAAAAAADTITDSIANAAVHRETLAALTTAMAAADEGALGVVYGLNDDEGVYRSDGAGGLTRDSDTLRQTEARLDADVVELASVGLTAVPGEDEGRRPVFVDQNGLPMQEWNQYRESMVFGRLEADDITADTVTGAVVVAPTVDMTTAAFGDEAAYPIATDENGVPILSARVDGTLIGKFDLADSVATPAVLLPDAVPVALGQANPHGALALDTDLMRFQGQDEDGKPRSYRARRTDPPVAIEEARGGVDMIHIDGQSLTVGRQGMPLVMDTALLPHNVLMLNDGGIRGEEGDPISIAGVTDFIPAVEASNATHGDTGMLAGARWYHEKLVANGKPRRVMLVRSHGKGGTTIAQAQPGETKFENGVAEITKAHAIAAEYGLPLTAPWWLWNQGQSDETLSQADYLAALTTYHAEYVATRRGITGQTTGPLMFIEPVVASRDEIFEGPILAQVEFADANPTTVFLTAPYYHFQGDTGLADSVHLTGEGYALLREYSFRAAYEVLVNGVAWKGVRPAGALQVSSNILTVPLAHPSGAVLSFDTSTLPDAHGTKGLVLEADTATITNVALSPVDATTTNLVVTLDGPPTNPTPTLRYALDSAGSPTDRSKAWGNIRDDDDAESLAVPGEYLRNWCVPFRVTE